MKRKATGLFAMFLVASLAASLHSLKAASNTADYKLVQKLTLGGEGGWDYFDVDPSTGQVFIPRGEHIMVLDSNGKQVADIGGVHGTHAIVFAPELKRAFLSAEAFVAVLDMEKMQVLPAFDLKGKDPDAILYDTSDKRVFTFNGGGTKDATAIDATTGEVVGSIPLGGKPETAQADGDGHIYVNVEDKIRSLPSIRKL
jgi:DNA-binding beta-propeller fold protein YncE